MNLLPSDSVKFEEIFYIEKFVEGAGELAVGSGSDHTYKTYLPWSPPPRGSSVGLHLSVYPWLLFVYMAGSLAFLQHAGMRIVAIFHSGS